MKMEPSIQSGNYMTSNLQDQNDDEEMPIASPDATNEVPLNDIDQEENEEATNKAAHSSAPIVPNTAKEINDGITAIKSSRRQSLGQGQSISGGFTLDRNNSSLKNLICYIKSAYRNNLTSPKWKNFKGLKLQVIEKIRLNNVIWRTWFEQCKH